MTDQRSGPVSNHWMVDVGLLSLEHSSFIHTLVNVEAEKSEKFIAETYTDGNNGFGRELHVTYLEELQSLAAYMSECIEASKVARKEGRRHG